jgi:tripeptide aminopeptidase
MINIPQEKLADRFMRYVQVDTQSDPNSEQYPTTEKQKDLSQILLRELTALGLSAETDEYGYVYAELPANSNKPGIPSICFCSHVDTAPDCSGTGVKPILHRHYQGQDIVLPDDATQVLRKADSPYLGQCMGHDIITASGNTLLGADDKSGVAVIMQAVEYLIQHPEIKHGPVKIVFTPDEEVGKGTARINIQKIGADFAYTLDGGEAGSLEDETFSADGASIVVHGVIVHPGYAKDKLKNAIKIISEIIDELPRTEWSPETTDGKQGFVHPVSISGIAEKASADFIVRDFSTSALALHHNRLRKIAESVVARYPGVSMEYISREQYRNMKDVLVKFPHVVEYAAEAIRRSGLQVIQESIRGGTDGSRLSYMGLPCPNIFTGMQNIHSKLEWISVQDMAKASETIVHLCMIWEEKS